MRDCLVVHSWRYLAAVTGDVLSLWDTERGLQLSEVLLPFGTDKASLEVLKAGDGFLLRGGLPDRAGPGRGLKKSVSAPAKKVN